MLGFRTGKWRWHIDASRPVEVRFGKTCYRMVECIEDIDVAGEDCYRDQFPAITTELVELNGSRVSEYDVLEIQIGVGAHDDFNKWTCIEEGSGLAVVRH